MTSRPGMLMVALCMVLACATRAVAAEPEFDAAQLEYFEKNVRPILVARCFECHDGKLDEPKGNLRLDSRAAMLKGGDTAPAVVPGKPKESLLIDAINYGETYQMPPKTRLPAAEVATLTKWVEMGAPWPAEAVASAGSKKTFNLAERKASHWCWQPIVAPQIPAVKNAGWVRSPLDTFILAKLEAKGLTPNAIAEKRVLIRRAYFDLIGLPPTPQQVEAFLKDESPEAFARVVDELLKSPHFGERWGRHWLDLVRYAESRGHEFDPDIPNAWQYRDYVIRALNADVPYDQFVIEHIAGDLLVQPRVNDKEGFNESVIGTGFWHLGEWVHSPVDIRKDECDRFDNMVDVFSKTFLGLTVSCARCHDHKFDAISQKDYYALFGYLQSSDYRQARFDTEHEHRAIAKHLAELDDALQAKTVDAYRNSLEPTVEAFPNYASAASKLIVAGGRDVKPDEIKAAAAATANKLDADLLAKWVAYLQKAQAEQDDLLQPLAAALTTDMQADALAKHLQKLQAEHEKRVAAQTAARAKTQVVVDYSVDNAPWMTDGPGFGSRPARGGELVLRTDGQMPLVLDVMQQGMARRDLRWKGLTRAAGTQNDGNGLGRLESAEQTLRTPTFEITHDKVCYLVQGAGRAFAAIDSHRLIAGPLHGQTIVEWDNAAGARWVTHHLGAYKGHRVHIEFSPRGNEDLRVLMVVCGETLPTAYLSPCDVIAPAIAGSTPPSTTEWCQQYKNLLKAAFAKSDATTARTRAWLIEHQDLFLSDTQRAALTEKLTELSRQYQDENAKLVAGIKLPSRTAPAMWDGNGEDERLLVRGNSSTPKDLVPRRFLSAIVGEQTTSQPGSGRLTLAKQVLADNNPLTARVMANRIWHHLMGRGIVPTTDNFGVLGQTPTHPELLDHLATEFRREGWSMKKLIRSIMLSSTYQMSSTPSEADREIDPQNLLWHRANIKRLQGEAIRDEMLALSGRMNKTMFGPPVPIFLTAYMQGRGRPGGSGPLDGDGRRSIYISVRRNFLSPMMLAFDAPSPFSTMGKRNVSNVPAQALMLMNDPFVVDQAKLWAKRTLADAALTTIDARVTKLYEEAFARAPTAKELASANAFLAKQAEEYKLPPESVVKDERVWSDLCHVLMNVKEFIFIP